jgi:predicted lipoprotein
VQTPNIEVVRNAETPLSSRNARISAVHTLFDGNDWCRRYRGPENNELAGEFGSEATTILRTATPQSQS